MTNHSLTISRARIKLYARHLSEWTDLVAMQRIVWTIVHAEFAQQLSLCGTDGAARFRLKTNQADRFNKLMADQSEIRAQLKERHQYDFVLLEQLDESPNGTERAAISLQPRP